MIEGVSILAGMLELIAIVLIGPFKRKIGFIIAMAGNILWVTYTLKTSNALGLWFVSPVAFVINIVGYWRWRRDENS